MNTPAFKRKVPLVVRVEGAVAFVQIRSVTTLIDAEDVPLLEGWTLAVQHKKNYVTLQGSSSIKPRPHKLLARVLMKAPPGMVVDHINHNTLDNRKANLRICTSAENARNTRGHRVRVAKYKGVCFMRRRAHLSTPWCAQINHKYRVMNLGYYATEEEAAQVYNDKAVELFGEFAHLNKIPSPH